MVTRAQQMILDLSNTSNFRVSESSQEIYMDCPFCGKRNKLYISPEGRWICFRCENRGGSVTSFVVQYEECTYKEARQILKENHYRESSRSIFANHKDNGSLFEALATLDTKKAKAQAKKCPNIPSNLKFLKIEWNNPEAYSYLWYLYKRGVTPEQVQAYNIGYVKSGEVKRTNNKPLHIENSVVFPTYNQQGKMVYWNTRSIELHPFIKSINAMSEPNQYSRKDVVWNMNKIHSNSYMVICEGVFNALTSSVGPYTGIATFGKAITDSQVQLMKKLNPKRYYIFLDNDAKDQELKLAKRLKQTGIDYDRIYLVINPYGDKDANDLGQVKVKQLLDQARPIDLVTLFQLAKEGV